MADDAEETANSEPSIFNSVTQSVHVLTVPEGSKATETGTLFTTSLPDSAAFRASIGDVNVTRETVTTQTEDEDGNEVTETSYRYHWDWEWNTLDGPDDLQRVTLTAFVDQTDEEGTVIGEEQIATYEFDLVVANAGP